MWRRALAFLVDLVPLAILVAVENAVGVADDRPVGWINFALLMIYFAGMNYWYGGTVGKLATGLRVALPASPSVPLLLIVRAFVKIACLFPPLAIAYGLVAVWRDDGRSLADLAAGTTVVEVPSYAAPEPLPTSERFVMSILVVLAPCLLLVLLLPILFGWALIEQILLER